MKLFNKKQNIIVTVMVVYFLGSIMMNILTMKTLLIGNISVFTCGLMLTPFVFACNDILTECAGEKFAFKCILIGAGINLAWSLLTGLAVVLPGNNEYIADCFKTILGSTWRITSASIIAYIGGGWLNNKVMSKLHQKDGDKGYYKRAILSTAIGQLVDDYVFVFLAFAPFGISAIENPWSAILTVPFISCVAETVIEAIFTPISKKVCNIYNEEARLDSTN